MKGSKHLNVAIDPQIMPGTDGGVAQAAMSLVSGLGKLTDGPEIYTIIVHSHKQLEWLKPFAGPNQRFIMRHGVTHSDDTVPEVENRSKALLQFIKSSFGPARPYLRYVWRLFLLKRQSGADFSMAGFLKRFVSIRPHPLSIGISDGFYESLGCHVLHLPAQSYVFSTLPTIYNPHDLQHEHYPQFFSPSALKWRDEVYRAGCHLAHTVVVGSQWIKDDVVRCYGVSHDKVQVIPEAAPPHLNGVPSKSFLTEIANKYRLEQPFAFYPAVTWPHKQHIALLEAIASLRDKRKIVIRLVCTGSRYETHWPEIITCMERLNLSGQVKFLGFVPDEDLRALYRLSQFLIQPSLFEASSLPIYEAWLEGVPVACSNVSALPDQVKDAALLFDPHNVESIADAIRKMSSDTSLRKELQANGFRRLRDFDLGRTSKALRAVYRRAARFPLTEEDRYILNWDWMRDSNGRNEN